jgi:hypothetical protein
MTDDLRTQLESKTDDELIEMLADRESGDYRPEAIAEAQAILAARGVAMGAPASEGHDEIDFTDLVTVAAFMSHVAAEDCAAGLRAAGFAAIARDTAFARSDNLLTPLTGGLRVAVPSEQAADAREFLSAADRGEMAAASACPACGSSDTGSEVRKAPPEDIADRLMVFLGDDREHTWFRCRACGHEWQ